MSLSAQRNPVAEFSRGFFSPLHGARFLWRHPVLLRFVAIPLLINCVVFTAAVYLGLDLFQHLVARYLPPSDAWYWMLLASLLWGVALLVAAVLVFFGFTVVGNLIAAPFNDLLSARVEEQATGVPQDEPFSWRVFWSDSIFSFLNQTRKIALFVGGMLVLLLLNLIPVAGSVLYAVLSLIWTLFFLAVEYLGYAMARRRLSFGTQRRFVMSRPAVMAGFSCGVLAVLAIPFLQLFCIPVAVSGATLLWCEEQRTLRSFTKEVP